jgi:hypothetical protein
MNQSQSDRIHELCSNIAVERDRKKFLSLVEELNHILAEHDRNFHNGDGTEKQEES